jgi:hypothetical protein
MPRWGLTVERRGIEPWGLSENWLKPAKTITDPVHGDIFVTVLESALLDSPPMQRLRRGTSHLVYPGATHSRFSHSMGTLRTAQDLMDAVVGGLSGPRPAPNDLLAEWHREGGQLGPDGPTGVSTYDFKVAEATVLARQVPVRN